MALRGKVGKVIESRRKVPGKGQALEGESLGMPESRGKVIVQRFEG